MLNHLPTIRLRKQRLLTQLINLALPLLLRLPRRIHSPDFLLFNLRDRIYDPVSLGFDAGGAVSKRGGTPGTVEEEHVGVVVACHAQVGPSS